MATVNYIPEHKQSPSAMRAVMGYCRQKFKVHDPVTGRDLVSGVAGAGVFEGTTKNGRERVIPLDEDMSLLVCAFFYYKHWGAERGHRPCTATRRWRPNAKRRASFPPPSSRAVSSRKARELLLS